MPRAQFVFLRLLVSAYILYLEAISAKVRQFTYCIYNHRTTKTNQKYPSVNL